MDGLQPGDNIDLRGCTITESFWSRLRAAVHDGERPRFGLVRFNEATFEGDTDFDDAQFDDADFRNATFEGGPSFVAPHFTGDAQFQSAVFGGTVNFEGGQYDGTMFFERVKFSKSVTFSDLSFKLGTWFNDAQFDGDLMAFNCNLYGGLWLTDCRITGQTCFMDCEFGPSTFSGTRFEGVTSFARATFKGGCNLEKTQIRPDSIFGPIVCEGPINLTDARITAPTVMEVSAAAIHLCDATLQESVTIRARYASIDLTRVRLFYPCTVSTDHAPSERGDESRLPSLASVEVLANQSMWQWMHDPVNASIASLEGVDSSFLLLVDVSLLCCEFSGAHHLDQIRLEGYWILGGPPLRDRWRGILPFSPARRQVVEEERKWRALRSGEDDDRTGWGQPPERGQDVPGLPTLAAVYRQLRKAREDAKDEPGAADFYYGEMEMRRHGRSWKTTERWLLQGYWLLSGYGLRASRALGWLALAMMTTILLMMGFGLPQSSPKQEATGTVPPGGGKVTFEIDRGEPKNPARDRFTTKRFDKALTVTLNSVVFRSSGQDLTTAGGYIEMASRFSEPVLLGLAALAIRGRVKR
ncbi:pentapeptide repeat-containing protein [Streptomyces nigrescens]